MAGRTTELRKAIKDVFIPCLAAKGFAVDNRHAPGTILFRRTADDRLHICDIQWEKYGKPRFILNVGETKLKDRQPETIGTWDCETYLQLKPKSGASTGNWFRQDRPLFYRLVTKQELYPASEVVKTLITLFAEAEEFWDKGLIGPHIQAVRQARP